MADRFASDFYDDAFADVVLSRRDDPAVQQAVDFLIERLRLQPGDRVLDQGCGTGRLLLPLAARGLHAVGVDASDRYITRARSEAERLGLQVELHAGDAAALDLREPCVAAFER